MHMKKILRICISISLVAILTIGIYINAMMPIFTGYAAKNLASAVFISGRTQADVEAHELNFSFVKYARNKVDYDRKRVTSSFLWGRSTAVYRNGYGVTLVRGCSADDFQSQKYPLTSVTQCRALVFPEADSLEKCRLEPIAKALVDERAYNGTPFAFVVLHRGAVAAERYREGIDASTRLISWSMAKSFTNALAGIMAGDGLVDIHAPMDIPEWQNDGRKYITLNDMMQMQSGLEWNEDYGSRSDVNVMLHCERDMGLYAQSKALEYEPGTHWYYSSGSTNVVMRYLRGRFESDQAFLAYLQGRLFAPLGIADACFEPDMSGTPVGSSYLYMRARDFARFGQMYLDGGVVEGERVLPEGWVEYTVTPASASGDVYGSFFWLNRSRECPDVPDDMFSCDGHDGQQIYIIPSKELVVVVLGYSPRPDHVIDFNGLLRDIIKAVES